MITRIKALFLEQFPNGLTDEDKSDLKEYYQSQAEKNKDVIQYFKEIKENEPEELKLSPKQIWNYFLDAFKQHTGKEYVRNDDTRDNLNLLCHYFAGADITKFKTIHNEPDLNKGLLLVGDYGTGKSDTMKVFQKMFSSVDALKFAYYSCNQVVHQFESCTEQQDRTYFWKSMVSGTCYFDDVKTEQLASNYGKKNIIKDIIERRYEAKKLTFISCNFKEGSKSMADALNEFRDLYGARVYDRLYEMFNIIEWKGQSFRK